MRASKLELTASDSSIGSSGGTTDVNINVHSKNNLYLFRSGSSVPEIENSTYFQGVQGKQRCGDYTYHLAYVNC